MLSYERLVSSAQNSVDSARQQIDLCEAKGHPECIFNCYKSITRNLFEIALYEWRQGVDPRPSMNSCLDAAGRYLESIQLKGRDVFDHRVPTWSIAYVVGFLVDRPFPRVIDFSIDARNSPTWALPEITINALYGESISHGRSIVAALRGPANKEIISDTFETYFDLLEGSAEDPGYANLVLRAEANYRRRKKGNDYLAWPFHGGGEYNPWVIDWLLAAILKKKEWQGASQHRWPWDVTKFTVSVDISWATKPVSGRSTSAPFDTLDQTVGGAPPVGIKFPRFPSHLPMFDDVKTSLSRSEKLTISKADQRKVFWTEIVQQHRSLAISARRRRYIPDLLAAYHGLIGDYARIAAEQWLADENPRSMLNAVLDAGEEYLNTCDALGVHPSSVRSDIGTFLAFIAVLADRPRPSRLEEITCGHNEVHASLRDLTIAALDGDPFCNQFKFLKSQMTSLPHVALAEASYRTYLDILEASRCGNGLALHFSNIITSHFRDKRVSALIEEAERNFAARASDTMFNNMSWFFHCFSPGPEQIDWQLAAVLKKIGWTGSNRHTWKWD